MDPRTRQNRTNLHNEGFKRQLVGIVEAYITWQDAIGEAGLNATLPSVPMELCQGTLWIEVVDVFCKISLKPLLALANHF